MTANDRIHVPPGPARRVIATLIATVGTIVWAHAFAGVLRAASGIPLEDFAPASLGLTIGAVLTALAGGAGIASRKRALSYSTIAALGSAGAIAALNPGAFVPALGLLPAGALFAVIAAWLATRIPSSLDALAAKRPKVAAVWVLIALVAVIQVGRLATYMSNVESDWFLSTRHPFYAKHECATAYAYGAELAKRGEPNIYDAAHYPGLNPEATPQTGMVGMKPEDPYQYAPQFLLWPRLAIEATHDYGALRTLWFGANVTLCIGAVLLLAAWVGGGAGMTAGLFAPVVLASFPALHNFQYGQFHFAAIALAILALLAFQHKRNALGGGLLAVSILSKLFPAVLVIPLVVQKRWRALAWTAAMGGAITVVALAVLGPAPFVAFLDYQLPRISDGSAFAFDEAWPEMATLVIAGNQGVHGVVDKLAAMGLSIATDSLARTVNLLYAAALLVIAVVIGMRIRRMGRFERAVAWVSLVGMASLSSTGAWADYVPLTCVWLLTMLVPVVSKRPFALAGLVVCGLMQVFLLGTMPLGSWSGGMWMMPLSLFGALAMLVSFAVAALAITTHRVGFLEVQPARSLARG